ncbi:MAG: S1 RNA-binding domain-containing protein [Clostridia bacterium]|nr:S1 RNA-binding domain-containing protein [Clostridia bacterium]MBO5300341.1 S1 RNA-binding domain-containing protein [Clostridia bacterium]
MAIEVGKIYDGKVTGLSKFGAFVQLPEGKSGMVHISEVSNNYVNDIHDHLTEGNEVRVKVIGIDEKGRINLSIKKAVEPEKVPEKKPVSFEDMLSKFKQESDDKFADYRMSKENRRSDYAKRRK